MSGRRCGFIPNNHVLQERDGLLRDEVRVEDTISAVDVPFVHSRSRCVQGQIALPYGHRGYIPPSRSRRKLYDYIFLTRRIAPELEK